MSAPQPAAAREAPRGGQGSSGAAAGSLGSPKRIAICSDDFGLHDGVNHAVLDLAARGRLQAIGCMVGAPAWGAGSERLRGVSAEAVDVGLHLDFTEHPLSPAIRLPLGAMIVRAYGRRLDAAQLRAEVHAQLDAFEHAMQRQPAFIDGHQHVHQLPMVRDALLQALHERDAGHRPWLRSTRRPQRSAGFKPWLIETLGARALAKHAAHRGLAQNAHLLGVYDFQGDAAGYQARLAHWLAAAVDGDVLMCHPSAPTTAADALIAARGWEYAALSSPVLPELLAQHGVMLAPISQVMRSAT